MRSGKLMMDEEEEKAMGLSFTFEEHTIMNDNICTSVGYDGGLFWVAVHL